MAEEITVKAGDTCPIDGGAFVVDHEQDPDTLIDSKQRNEIMTGSAARFERQTRAKAKDEGVIHRCVTCGYRARFKDADQEQADREQVDRDQADRDRVTRDRREREQRAQRDQDDRDREARDRESAGGQTAGAEASAVNPASGAGSARRRAT